MYCVRVEKKLKRVQKYEPKGRDCGDFQLDEDSVAAALEAALGGSAIDLMVTCIKDKVFSFVVSCKQVGFHIVDSRSYACNQFKCYFHLWGNGGPNWWREFLIWKKERSEEHTSELQSRE